VEAVLFGLLLGDLISLLVLLGFAKEQLTISPLLGHVAILALPVGVAALGPLLPGGGTLVARAFMLLAATAVIGLDAAIVYRQHFVSFTARLSTTKLSPS
jgi:hypothetical protein